MNENLFASFIIPTKIGLPIIILIIIFPSILLPTPNQLINNCDYYHIHLHLLHNSINLGIAIPLRAGTVITGFCHKTKASLAHFLPQGAPVPLIPILHHHSPHYIYYPCITYYPRNCHCHNSSLCIYLTSLNNVLMMMRRHPRKHFPRPLYISCSKRTSIWNNLIISEGIHYLSPPQPHRRKLQTHTLSSYYNCPRLSFYKSTGLRILRNILYNFRWVNFLHSYRIPQTTCNYGSTFLIICFLRQLKYHFSSNHHFGFKAAA
eukprot:bmy_05934T0